MARAKRNQDDDVMVAVQSGVVTFEGQEVLLVGGQTRARRGHEIVRQWPGYWKPIDVHYEVEQMTAAPGEKRGA